MTAAFHYASRQRVLSVVWGRDRAPTVAPVVAPEPAVRATVPDMPMDTKTRASKAGKASAEAKTPEERRVSASSAASKSHGPVARFRRAIKVWAEATDDERREIRRELREAGIIR